MNLRRIVLVVAGIGIAVAAVYLLFLGFRGLRPASGPAAAAAEGATEETPGAQEDGEKAPRWEDFAHPEDAEADAERPIEGVGMAAASPFDRAWAQSKLEQLALRLEGVAPGDLPLALISGRVARIGDTIDDFQVIRIDRFGVSLLGPAGLYVDLAPGTSTAPPEPPVTSETRRGAGRAASPAAAGLSTALPLPPAAGSAGRRPSQPPPSRSRGSVQRVQPPGQGSTLGELLSRPDGS